MNLHALVRPAITSVNPDILGTWRESSGATPDASYKRTPTFTDHADVPMQVQAMSGSDLFKVDYQNLEKVTRAVYLYGAPQGVVRVDAKGGDLLLFPQVLGEDAYTWLVFAVLEPWTTSVDANGWTKVAVVLQDTPP